MGRPETRPKARVMSGLAEISHRSMSPSLLGVPPDRGPSVLPHAAGGDEDVRLRQVGLELLVESVGLEGTTPAARRLRPGLAGHPGHREGVRLPDAALAERLTGLGQRLARRERHDAGPGPDRAPASGRARRARRRPSRGRADRPASRGRPCATSSPAGRTFVDAPIALPIAIDDPTTATSSRRTTASVPSGSDAPPVMRTASPCVTRAANGRPAAASPMIVRLTADVAASDVSLERIANPSVAADGNAGRSSGAVTVSASTQPCASVIESSSASRRRDTLQDAVLRFRHREHAGSVAESPMMQRDRRMSPKRSPPNWIGIGRVLGYWRAERRTIQPRLGLARRLQR